MADEHLPGIQNPDEQTSLEIVSQNGTVSPIIEGQNVFRIHWLGDFISKPGKCLREVTLPSPDRFNGCLIVGIRHSAEEIVIGQRSL